MSTPQDEAVSDFMERHFKRLRDGRKEYTEAEVRAVMLGMQTEFDAQTEALAAARRDALEEAAQIVEKATNRSRWVHAVMNSTVTAPCEIAAAIRATLTPTAPGAQEQA